MLRIMQTAVPLCDRPGGIVNTDLLRDMAPDQTLLARTSIEHFLRMFDIRNGCRLGFNHQLMRSLV